MEESTFAVEGEWVRKKDANYFTYVEPAEQLGNTRTTVRASGGSIRLVRFGDVRMIVEYQPGVTTRESYDTPYGSLALKVTTHHCRIFIEEKEALLEWSYDLHINEQKQGSYTMEVRVQEEIGDEHYGAGEGTA